MTSNSRSSYASKNSGYYNQETNQPPDLTNYQLVRDRDPRTRTKPLRFRDKSNMVAYAFVAAEKKDTHEPLTYQEAVACEDSSKWKASIKKEMDSLRKNKTWELVDHPAGQKLVSCKWPFKIKERIEVRYISIQVILALTACKDYELEQLDVKTAFLHENLKEAIYMRQPPRYEQGNKYENHLCNLCGNNSHDGYDCQQQFSFVYEHEPSYNQNYNGNYYSHDLPSFPCYDNCEESHENFQCQPITFQIYFSGSDQIQTTQYPDIHLSSQETSDEVFQANHSIQNEESFENPSNEIDVSNPNKEKEIPPQDSDFHQLIEECSPEICEKQNALNSKRLLINSNSQRFDKKEEEVKNVVEQPAERGNRNIQSLQNFRVVHKNSISLNNTSQISSIHAIAPVLSIKKPEHLLSMGYEHLSSTPETESDEVTESNAENLLPIPSKCEVTLEDKRECDFPIYENILVCDNHYDIFFDSKIDDDISVYDDDFEDIEYVEASFPNPEIISVEEENEETRSGNTTHANDSLLEYDSFCFEIEPDQERLINLVENDILDDSTNDPLLEEADLFLAADHSITPDAKTDAGEEIPVEMNDKDEDIDYSSFIFVIFDKEFSFLFVESEDTIFDPDFDESPIEIILFQMFPKDKLIQGSSRAHDSDFPQ
nr:retrovirus-related Pol polyprotein from transposon TNT 1-94 [Tanacetum cinerariifolium]